MKIVSVRPHLISCPLAEPLVLPYHGGVRTIVKRDAMLIRVETGNGRVGYAPGEGSEKAERGIRETIAPFLEGRLLADPDAVRVQFMDGPGRSIPGSMRLYAMVEIALYDLVGKAKGAPVSELLGGRVRDHVSLYASAGMYGPPGHYAEEARALVAQGFRAYKMRAGMGPDRDVEAVRRVREAVGYGADILVDAHTWWRMGDRNYSAAAIEMIAGELGELQVGWLEEPLPPHDHTAYHLLRNMGYVPLASGEHEPSESGFLDLISHLSVDYVQMDVLFQGGYGAARRLLPEVAQAGLKFAFHSWGTDLEVIAAAHLGVCWPGSEVEWLEYPCYTGPTFSGMYPFPAAREILKRPLRIEQGDLIVPAAPGLGVEIDESVVERYPWVPGPWSYFQIESPAETRSVTSDHSEQWHDR